MLKRFYSKRSGFTLVEIIVAFAVFSIMATMIVRVLNLSVTARTANVRYQDELDAQIEQLTKINKDKKNFKNTDGKIMVNIGGVNVELNYDRLSAIDGAEFDAEGLNYFLAGVDYNSSGEKKPSLSDPAGGNNNTGSQASRMDTRITGSTGIDFIEIWSVVKDTHAYSEGDEFYLPEGHTRYFIKCAASSGVPQTMLDEDIPYAQYRLYFYHCPEDPTNADKVKEALDEAESEKEYTAGTSKYKKDVYKAAQITKVGYLSTDASVNLSDGLQSSETMRTYGTTSNMYTIEQMGSNAVRIGTPFKAKSTDDGTNGVKFDGSKASYFYVEFDGDPHLTVNSFGHNTVTATSEDRARYTACPKYLDTYNADGTPKYEIEKYKAPGEASAVEQHHVNIYGAFMPTRHYITGSPATPSPGGDDAGDDAGDGAE